MDVRHESDPKQLRSGDSVRSDSAQAFPGARQGSKYTRGRGPDPSAALGQGARALGKAGAWESESIWAL